MAVPLRWYHHLTAVLLLSHTGMQLFLPYSHFITKVCSRRWEFP